MTDDDASTDLRKHESTAGSRGPLSTAAAGDTNASRGANAGVDPAGSGAAKRRRRLRLGLGSALFAALAAVAALYFFWNAGPYRETDDAYVHGNQIVLTPRVAGTVIAINADDTDLVRQGQSVIVLDDSDAKVSLQETEAALGSTMRKVRQYYVDVARMRAGVDLAKVELSKAQDDYQRRADAENGSVSKEEITHARQGLDVAREALAVSEQRLAGAQVLVANADIEHLPAVRQAAARVLDADLALQRSVVYAPETGYVARRSVEVGQRATPGTPLLTIIPLDQIWVEANFKEEQLRAVRIGQPVSLTADFYGKSVTYRGRVVGLGAGTGASFALLPPQEASGNWIKILQRVPVRIALDPKQLERFPLRLGLSMHVVIDTHDRKGSALAHAPVEGPVYATSIYTDEWTKANQLVQTLVATNLRDLSPPARRNEATATRRPGRLVPAHE